jgi:hypothetical protein
MALAGCPDPRIDPDVADCTVVETAWDPVGW